MMKISNIKFLILFFSLYSVNQFLIAQTNSNPWPSTGNVGIGTTTPTGNLQVKGTVVVTGKSTTVQTGYYNFFGTLATSFNGATIYAGMLRTYTAPSGTGGINGSIPSSSPTWYNPASYERIDGSICGGCYLTSFSLSQTPVDKFTIGPNDKDLLVVDQTKVNVNSRLVVNDRIEAVEYHSCITPGTCPDYVFEKEYKLMDMATLKKYLEVNKHLPDVPSAKEMEAGGMNMAEMNLALLKKVEEMTLYILQMEERLKKVENK